MSIKEIPRERLAGLAPVVPPYAADPSQAVRRLRRVNAAPTAAPADLDIRLLEADDAPPLAEPGYTPSLVATPTRGRVRLGLEDIACLRGVTVQVGPHRGKANLSAIVRGTGLSYATVHRLLRRPDDLTGVSFDVLTRLCEFLHCEPGDLLVWEPVLEAPAPTISGYFQRQEATQEATDHALID